MTVTPVLVATIVFAFFLINRSGDDTAGPPPAKRSLESNRTFEAGQLEAATATSALADPSTFQAK